MRYGRRFGARYIAANAVRYLLIARPGAPKAAFSDDDERERT